MTIQLLTCGEEKNLAEVAAEVVADKAAEPLNATYHDALRARAEEAGARALNKQRSCVVGGSGANKRLGGGNSK